MIIHDNKTDRTSNDREIISFLLDEGCDAIITNYPDVAPEIRDEKYN